MSQVYIKEIYYRCLYVFVSFSFSVCVSFWYTQSLFLLQTYPLLKLSDGRFIATQVTELVDTTWVLVLATALNITFPVFLYQIIQFSKSGWYSYQLYFVQKLFAFSIFFHWLFLYFCYAYLFPGILAFLSQWEISQPGSTLNVSVEFKIMSYINWILAVWYCLSTSVGLLGTCMLHIIFLSQPQNVYKVFKLFKKQILFVTLVLFLSTSFSSLIFQVYCIFLIFVSYELIFFFSCYRSCNL
nr:Sec-independent protein translocase component TatC [Gloiopeltis furcata]